MRMNEEFRRRLIMKNGERLRIRADHPKRGSFTKTLPHSFDDVISKIESDVRLMNDEIESDSHNFMPDNLVAEIELEPGFTAKSYEPLDLFKKLNIAKVGTRIKQRESSQDDSRIEFVKFSKDQLINLPAAMEAHKDIQYVQKSVRIIRTIRLASPFRTESLEENWEGRIPIEIVVHPIASEEIILDFLSSILSQDSNVRLRTLETPNSPFYIFASVKKEEFDNLITINPIRSMGNAKVRILSADEGRIPLKISLDRDIWTPEKIAALPVIGVFDGGIENTNFKFRGLVQRSYWDKQEFPISNYHMDHGSLVAGAAIYGPISDSMKSIQPRVRIEDIPVLNNETENKIDKIADYIKQIIPRISNINVFNISFGPEEAITDDHISYFTAVLDELAYRYHKLFIVATGNDGIRSYPENRVQAPSDGMNVLSVGAYDYDSDGEKIVADYSSIGPGRESAKIKPEIVEFGGSHSNPLVLVGADSFATDPSSGTSFAAPIVAAKLAQTIATSPDITPLVAKGLAIHQATPQKQPNDKNVGISKSAGFGFMSDDVEDLYTDSEDEVTIIYHDVIALKDVSRLLLPIPNRQNFDATKYDITWTIVTMSAPNASSSDAYSNFAINDTLVVDDEHVPVGKSRITRSNNKYKPEPELRANDFKWDTIVKKKIAVNVATLGTPYIEISGLSRSFESSEPVEFAIIVTLKSYNNQTLLSDEILNEYDMLEPLTLSETLTTQVDA
ncbi:S8 family peptidase [Weissella paramesenteroides]|nr:S8 family peptidase [Weissella paramesenteroides]